MSFASRHSPRFSYATSPAVCPTEFLGQSTFWQENEPPRHSCTERPATAYVASRPMSPSSNMGYAEPVRAFANMTSSERGYFTEDEKRLFTLIGGGLIVAILVDAVAHYAK